MTHEIYLNTPIVARTVRQLTLDVQRVQWVLEAVAALRRRSGLYHQTVDLTRDLASSVADLKSVVSLLDQAKTAINDADKKNAQLFEPPLGGDSPGIGTDDVIVQYESFRPGLVRPPGSAPDVDPEVLLAAGLTELQLRQEGLLTGPTNARFSEWLTNAASNGVDPDVVIEIVDQANLAPADFRVLDAQTRVVDGGGKSYFMLAPDATADEVRRSVVMTYVLNADTGADQASGVADAAVGHAGYSADEVRRILGRQQANSWSYDGGGPSPLVDVGTVLDSGGRVAATPNGMLLAVMGAGGAATVKRSNAPVEQMAPGDLFVLPQGAADPVVALTAAIESDGRDGVHDGDVGLGVSLRRAELESRQWASEGWMRYVDLHAGSDSGSAERRLFAPERVQARMFGEGPQAWEHTRGKLPT